MTFDEKYNALLHAMQTGIAYTLEKDFSSGTPKHLRVGVNSAMVEAGVICKILIDKGIITLEEYQERVLEGLQKEVDMYEREISEHYGHPIKLG